MSTQNEISKVIEMIGLHELATKLGVTYQAIKKYRRDQVSHKKVLKLAELTGWQITPHDLRPDLYPYPTDAVPPEFRNIIADTVLPTEDESHAKRVA